ncbi:MAG: hypothetical protein A2Y07_02200 [Planctomycetes bacterium GWF2_50_10]|nr:MAG: hypothetical protein A2Y07_02200 [Planctomycetes bacterium GWF2_50_10]
MTELLRSLFESCVEIHPEDDILKIFKALPHCKGLLLFADESSRPILLIISADIRRLAVNRLSEDATVSGRRVKLKEITRYILSKCTYNDFASTFEHYKSAKALFPSRLADHVNLPAINFIKINTGAKWPAFTVANDISHDSKTKYFGPFQSRKSASDFIDILENAFALCKKYCLIDDPQKAASCPYYQMGTCKAPCLGKLSKDQYLEQVNDAVAAASGDWPRLVIKLQGGMKSCASQMQFEQAQLIKKQIESLSQLSKPEFDFVSELSQMNLLHLDIGPKIKVPGKKTKDQLFMPFMILGGIIHKLPDIAAGEVQQIFDSPLGPAPDIDLVHQMSISAFSLYRHCRSGLWLNLARLSGHEALEKITQYLAAPKPSSEHE